MTKITISVNSGTSASGPKPFAFVLMPFNSEFVDVYELGIKAACQAAGAVCERVDEQIFDENILARIYRQIEVADIIIAEMSGRNPNVFYETGYAHALSKRVILLTKEPKDIPFDVQHYSHIVYENITILRAQLEKKVKWCIDNPQQNFGSGSPIPKFSGAVFSHYSLEDSINSSVFIPVNLETSTESNDALDRMLLKKPYRIKIEEEMFNSKMQILNDEGDWIGTLVNRFPEVSDKDYAYTIFAIVGAITKLGGGIDSPPDLKSPLLIETAEIVKIKREYSTECFLRLPTIQGDFAGG